MSRWCAGVRGLAALAAVALVAGKVPAQDPLLGEARRLVSERRYGEAADVYRRSLERVPDDTTVLAELTAALDAAGRWRDAMPYLERLVGLSAPDAR
ncbi:MAG TPA: tetratricopeptide repeat protein, partial [Gemmatimonadaceae bacterium]|nr:tetratricopeptide repeat protein [Gemmatimonadaceae bacterium]